MAPGLVLPAVRSQPARFASDNLSRQCDALQFQIRPRDTLQEQFRKLFAEFVGEDMYRG